MINKCLSDDEETKVDRLSILLAFLGKTEIIYFVVKGPYCFTADTGAFTDNLMSKVVAPTTEMINVFYRNLSRDALAKLESASKRSKVKSIRQLLVHFYGLDFLPLAY
jgi:hypothetical protein